MITLQIENDSFKFIVEMEFEESGHEPSPARLQRETEAEPVKSEIVKPN